MKVAEKISARSNLEGRRRPIDTHVGARIRLRRGLLGMSQVQLGDVLGLSYEQVQKYERGADRVNAWCLFEISQVLVVPISYFFDDIPEGMSGSPFSGPRGRRGSFYGIQVSFAADEDDQLISREMLELFRAFFRIADPVTRTCMLKLMKSIVPPERKR